MRRAIETTMEIDSYVSPPFSTRASAGCRSESSTAVDHVSLMPQYEKPPQRLVLAPGQTARAVVVWRNLTTDEATIVNGEYLRVAGARGQPTHLLALHVDLGNTGVLALSPWARS